MKQNETNVPVRSFSVGNGKILVVCGKNDDRRVNLHRFHLKRNQSCSRIVWNLLSQNLSKKWLCNSGFRSLKDSWKTTTAMAVRSRRWCCCRRVMRRCRTRRCILVFQRMECVENCDGLRVVAELVRTAVKTDQQ